MLLRAISTSIPNPSPVRAMAGNRMLASLNGASLPEVVILSSFASYLYHTIQTRMDNTEDAKSILALNSAGLILLATCSSCVSKLSSFLRVTSIPDPLPVLAAIGSGAVSSLNGAVLSGLTFYKPHLCRG